MKKLLLCIFILFLLNPAQAVMLDTDLPDTVLFNFQVAESDEGPLSGVLPYDSTLGPAHQIVAETAAGGPDPTGWLDGPSFGFKGGLGVCKTMDCDASSDDTLGAGESILLEIGTTSEHVFLGDIYFANGTHGPTFAGDTFFGISINGGPIQQFLLTPVFSTLSNILLNDGDTVQFLFGGLGVVCVLDDTSCNEYKGEAFYVQGFGAVPIPAALPLFLSALFGFAFFSRKKKAAAA